MLEIPQPKPTCFCPNPIVTSIDKRGKPRVSHQDLSLHNPDLYEELYDPKQYRHLIKDWCVYCGEPLPNTWQYYWKMGNCCSTCSVEQSVRVMRKR